MHPACRCAHTSIKLGTKTTRRGAATAASSASASSSKLNSPFPYPVHRNPTPHQIFHLPRNATEPEIKDRYFDLVRLYHPDKTGLSVSPDIAHARFQAITSAYDALRGKTQSGTASESGASTLDTRYQTTASWRAMQRRRSQELYSGPAIDERWKDRVILFGVIATIAIVITHTVTTRREAMAGVLSRTRQSGSNSSNRGQQRRHEDDRLVQPDPGVNSE